MKRFVRRQEDVPYIKQPALSEVVKAIEDAWADIPGATIKIDKGSIRVKWEEEERCYKEFFNYDQEPKLCFEDGTCFWVARTYCNAGNRTKIQVSKAQSCPLAICSVPYMGNFHGHLSDINELEAAVLEFRKAKDKVDALLASEATEVK